jgi:hypothetical protein
LDSGKKPTKSHDDFPNEHQSSSSPEDEDLAYQENTLSSKRHKKKRLPEKKKMSFGSRGRPSKKLKILIAEKTNSDHGATIGRVGEDGEFLFDEKWLPKRNNENLSLGREEVMVGSGDDTKLDQSI